MPQYSRSVSQPGPKTDSPEKRIARARRIVATRARRQLDDGAYRLYCEVEDRAGKKLETFVHQARLAADLQISERTVIRRMKTLEAAGFVRKRRTQSGNRYRMLAVEKFLNSAEPVTSQAPPAAPPLMEPVLKNLGQSDRPAGGRELLVAHLTPFTGLGVKNPDGTEWNPAETAEILEAAAARVGVGIYEVCSHLHRVYSRVVRRPSWWPRSSQWFKATVDYQFGAGKRERQDFTRDLLRKGTAQLRQLR